MSTREVKGVLAKKGVPQTDDELNQALGLYFSAKRRWQNLKTRLDDRLKKVKDQYGLKMKPVKAEEDELANNIATYSEAHRAELTADGPKHRVFPNGIVGWRKGGWSHKITTSEAEVIAELKKKGLYDTYVIVTEKLDVQKLVRDRGKIGNTVAGFKILQVERFYIDPPKDKKSQPSN